MKKDIEIELSFVIRDIRSSNPESNGTKLFEFHETTQHTLLDAAGPDCRSDRAGAITNAIWRAHTMLENALLHRNEQEMMTTAPKA